MSKSLFLAAIIVVVALAASADAAIMSWANAYLTSNNVAYVAAQEGVSPTGLCYYSTWGSFYYVAVPSMSQVKYYYCSSKDCSGTCFNGYTYQPGTTVSAGRAALFTSYNFSGDYYSFSTSYPMVVQTTYSSNCTLGNTDKISQRWIYPAENVCLPEKYSGSTRYSCSLNAGSETTYSFSSTCSGTGSTVNKGTTCFDNDREKWYCGSGTGSYVVVFTRASAGAIASALVAAVLFAVAILI